MIITIDGPAGTGKSSVAKKTAEILGFLHMDTGAFYRALTYGVLQSGIDPADEAAVEKFSDAAETAAVIVDGAPRYFINAEDVTGFIRSEAVTQAVSPVSSYPGVRKKQVAAQRAFVSGIDAVSEGRDMGSHVFPAAEVKIYLTARPEIRAARRFAEMKAKGLASESATAASVQKEIELRDHLDSNRKTNPLEIPAGAHVIDTSDMTIDEVVFAIVERAKACQNFRNNKDLQDRYSDS